MSDRYVVLAAIDLENSSSLVFERAVFATMQAKNGELHLLNVSEPQLPAGTYPGFLPPPDVGGLDPARVVDFAKARLAELRKAHPSLVFPEVQVHTAIGRPADEIIWLAAHLDADVVVMATHGRKGLRRLLLGSVAERVIRLAGCPVVIVREKHHDITHKVPEIEPLCPDCASVRFETRGEKLWCARHSEHHVRAHVLSYTSATDSSPPHAYDSSTGT
ncbi:MAG TPA: universal stress protein [Polyangiaceae bacterium]|jgi:nucleotide-binding universal stress UspA family protein|nr:universal stress protein [Polyangiaceae bacterium]